VVITDQNMPGLTGAELAKQMLAVRPDLPILMLTGFSETISREQARALGIREFLLKPVLRRDPGQRRPDGVGRRGRRVRGIRGLRRPGA